MEVAGSRLIERGEHDHRQVGESRVGLLAAAEFPTVHDRHHEVQQNDIGALRGGQVLKRLFSVGDRRRSQALEREQLRHHLAQVRIVFDDENGAIRG